LPKVQPFIEVNELKVREITLWNDCFSSKTHELLAPLYCSFFFNC